MSRTIRKDKVDKKYLEGRNKEKVHYRCQCYFCNGGVKRDKINKALKKEMLKISSGIIGED